VVYQLGVPLEIVGIPVVVHRLHQKIREEAVRAREDLGKVVGELEGVQIAEHDHSGTAVRGH
jgi:hypothetical protein